MNSLVRLVLPDVQDLLREGSAEDIANALAPFHEADIADLLEELDEDQASKLLLGLEEQKRVDMLIASIHHFDLIRSIQDEPEGVYARSFPHPKFPEIEATRSSAILDYGTKTRCCLSINNCWVVLARWQRQWVSRRR